MSIIIEINTQSTLWDSKAIQPAIENAARVVLEKESVEKAFLSIALTDNAQIQELNHTYRGKDQPTNVLSFPDGERDPLGQMVLGDVILAYETIETEAMEQNKRFDQHLMHLLVHGTLHLLGYDHEVDHEATAMEAREIEILDGLGIANPYMVVS
jgi:probable rRNA maturation factor